MCFSYWQFRVTRFKIVSLFLYKFLENGYSNFRN